jgi:hypothetical protein
LLVIFENHHKKKEEKKPLFQDSGSSYEDSSSDDSSRSIENIVKHTNDQKTKSKKQDIGNNFNVASKMDLNLELFLEDEINYDGQSVLGRNDRSNIFLYARKKLFPRIKQLDKDLLGTSGSIMKEALSLTSYHQISPNKRQHFVNDVKTLILRGITGKRAYIKANIKKELKCKFDV